ncbi:glycoside hydrolase family 25 protein [Agrobacterium sp. ES01]|uniref:glycoside hydrolase family 25 protein n=1 Tax=Agrobacterium sp. ES01 TaxID=3420714 RepID=UPI003D143C02
MRSSVITAVIALVFLSGCTSSAGPESVLSVTSRETTGSISPSAPIPSAPVAGALQTGERLAASGESPSVEDAPHPTELAFAGSGADVQVFEAAIAPGAIAVPLERPEGRSLGRPKVYSQRFRDAKPINFGKKSPSKLAVHGVDVSRWQGDIDWHTLRRQGANFVYIKATDGGDHLDPMFKTNWRGAKDAGVRHGAYHFFYWCRTASSQADWFIQNVPREANALPPVIDVEWNHQSSCKKRPDRATVLEKMRVFMDRLERHYGKRPVIYTSPDFYADNLQGAFKSHPFWLRSVAAHPSKVYPDRRWVLWQYSGSGLSQGVDERIDLNVFNGSVDDWHRWLSDGA